MTIITLLGTIHNDPYGNERLKRALDFERPDIITLEANINAYENLKERMQEDSNNLLEEFRKRGMSQETVEFFKEYTQSGGFEIDTSREYANRNSIPIRYIDEEESSLKSYQDILSGIRQLLFLNDMKIFEGINVQGISEGVDNLYRDLENVFRGNIPQNIVDEKILNPTRGAILGRRDTHMANELEKLAEQYGDSTKIVHVGGALHNMNDSRGETLYSKIAHLHPKRKTLWQYR